MLEDYKASKKNDRRRKILKIEIQNSSFDAVYSILENKAEESTGYKEDRIRYDLHWMKKNSHKYHCTILNS